MGIACLCRFAKPAHRLGIVLRQAALPVFVHDTQKTSRFAVARFDGLAEKGQCLLIFFLVPIRLCAQHHLGGGGAKPAILT